MVRAYGTPFRVLQVISSMHIGGAERVVQHLVRSADPNRFGIDVWALQGGGIVGEELTRQGHAVLGPQTSVGRLARYTSPLWLAKVIKERRYDLVHTHGTSALLDVAPLRVAGLSPTVVHTFHFGNYPNVKRRRLLAERLACRVVDRLVAVSDSQRQTLLKYLRAPAARTVTIYNGVDDRSDVTEAARQQVRSELGFGSGEVVAATIAVMTDQKGIPYILEAAALSIGVVDSLRFLIVGGGPLLESLKRQASEMGLGGRVLFTGWRPDARRLLAAADLFVSASLWEGFAMVILEAMAAGKPVVATAVGDNARAVVPGHTGILVSPADSQALAAAVLRLATDGESRRELGAAGLRKYRAEFGVERMVRQYELLYERAIAGRGTSGDRR